MPVYESTPFAAQSAAGADINVIVGTIEAQDASGYGVTNVVVTPPSGFTTVTGQATNNVTLNVRQLRAGSVVTTFASVTTASGTNLVAETPLNVPVTNAAVALQANDVIDAVLHQNGTGQAIGAGLLVSVNVN